MLQPQARRYLLVKRLLQLKLWARTLPCGWSRSVKDLERNSTGLDSKLTLFLYIMNINKSGKWKQVSRQVQSASSHHSRVCPATGSLIFWHKLFLYINRRVKLCWACTTTPWSSSPSTWSAGCSAGSCKDAHSPLDSTEWSLRYTFNDLSAEVWFYLVQFCIICTCFTNIMPTPLNAP